ncbi:MAG: HEAT repeat domain-containing protein [Acidobacteria bacterium]|nr:HEAT repeat domain-containing protein [Acidobacteriota bacterium]
MDDDTVLKLLFGALRDVNNPGSRLKAIEVLARTPTDETIEEALIGALVYDEDPGVRLKALEGLKQYANEAHVRVAFMKALANDPNAGIRIEAINALTARNPKDTELAKSIQEVAKKDDNSYIQTKALQFVGTAK